MRLFRRKGFSIICIIVVLLVLAPRSALGIEEVRATGDITPPHTDRNVSYQLGNHYYKYTNDEVVEVSLTPRDDMPGIIETMYRINAGAWQSYSGTFVLTEEGEYILEYYSKDVSENEEVAKKHTFGIDRTAPVTSRTIISGGVEGEKSSYTGDVTVTLSAVDVLSGMIHEYFPPTFEKTEYRIAGGEWQAYTVPIVFSAVGDHPLEYRSLDAVGNAEEIHSLDIHIISMVPTLDVTPPTTYSNVSYQLGNHYYKYTDDETVEVTLTAVDDTPGVIDSVYRINAGAWQSYSGTIVLTEEGEYILEYYSKDVSGNVEVAKKHTFGIDRTAPVTSRTITSGGVEGEKSSYTGSVTVTLSATDVLSGMNHEYFPPTFEKTEYRIAGGEWQAYTVPIVFSAVGDHPLEYRSLDAVGNTEVIQTITIRIVAPPSGSPGSSPSSSPSSFVGSAPPSTPLAPVPSNTSEATIKSSEGGMVSIKDTASVTIPAGALTVDGLVQITVVPNDQTPSTEGLNLLSQIIEFTNSTGNIFDKPVVITLSLSDPKPEQFTAVYYYSELQKRWIYVGGTTNTNGTISVAVDHFTKFAAFTYEPTSFLDLKGHWAEPYTNRLVNMGVIHGFEDGTFQPDAPVTRAQFVKMIVDVLGVGDSGIETKQFADQSNIPDWAEEAIAIAVHEGFIRGYEEQGVKYIAPMQTITRQEMALILNYAVKYAQGDELQTAATTMANSDLFVDQSSIAEWAKDAVHAAVHYHIIQGYEDGTFRPNDFATRAEAATMLNKLLSVLYI